MMGSVVRVVCTVIQINMNPLVCTFLIHQLPIAVNRTIVKTELILIPLMDVCVM